jgi:hypothetical protein
MSNNPQLSPAGSSTYDSNTLHVGDGTWDSQRDDFLLPNLMGYNFATMQYNGQWKKEAANIPHVFYISPNVSQEWGTALRACQSTISLFWAMVF